MTKDANLRVLIADDHALVREGVRRLIEEQPDMTVVGEAGDGMRAVQLTLELAPHVVLVDVSMPPRDGVEATRMIRKGAPEAKVIALTRHDDPSFVRLLFDAGATGYVLKQSASSELTEAIRRVAAGEEYIDAVIRYRVAARNAAPAESEAPLLDAELTPDEEAVLRLIADGSTHRQIATDLSMDLDQVLALRASAMARARLASRAVIVRYAHARGWLS